MCVWITRVADFDIEFKDLLVFSAELAQSLNSPRRSIDGEGAGCGGGMLGHDGVGQLRVQSTSFIVVVGQQLSY